jgi:hypothetical protein
MLWRTAEIGLLVVQGACWLVPPLVLAYRGGLARDMAGLLWFWLIPVLPVFLAEATGLVERSVENDGHLLWLGGGWLLFLPVLAIGSLARAVTKLELKATRQE